MSDVVISATGIGKRYPLGRSQQHGEPYVALRDVLARSVGTLGRSALNTILRKPAPRRERTEDFWALKDVSFEIARGDVVGIIGRNGAGKSTLLKILSRITEPTTGRVAIKGRIASLLEVGTGFHPELTGRENILLNGAILGMRRAEIRRMFDAIVAFAEVEPFLDTPVKRYSSGMYVRLAFAIAAHLEPEILVIDEVLAVGDAEFQKRCLGKMQDVASQGRTVLFVSHNMGAIAALCPRSLYLKRGGLVASGSTKEVIAQYGADSSEVSRGGSGRLAGSTMAIETLQLRPQAPRTRGHLGVRCEFLSTGANTIHEAALLVFGSTGQRIGVLDLRRDGKVPASFDSRLTLNVLIEALPLVEGEYSIGLYLVTDDFSGNLLDLASLHVQPEAMPDGHVPYPALHRGVVDMEFSADIEAKE